MPKSLPASTLPARPKKNSPSASPDEVLAVSKTADRLVATKATSRPPAPGSPICCGSCGQRPRSYTSLRRALVRSPLSLRFAVTTRTVTCLCSACWTKPPLPTRRRSSTAGVRQLIDAIHCLSAT
jgi:hypothetical protein